MEKLLKKTFGRRMFMTFIFGLFPHSQLALTAHLVVEKQSTHSTKKP